MSHMSVPNIIKFSGMAAKPIHLSEFIIQSGIKKVIYLSDKYADTDGTKASRRMLTQAGVELVQLRPEKEELVIKFK